MARDLTYWLSLTAANVRTDPLSVITIGYECWKADQVPGENASVWHQSAKFFSYPCHCMSCVNPGGVVRRRPSRIRAH